MKQDTEFDPSRQFDSVQEAVDYALKQSVPDDEVWAIIKANADMGEIGFAAELLSEFFNARQPREGA